MSPRWRVAACDHTGVASFAGQRGLGLDPSSLARGTRQALAGDVMNAHIEANILVSEFHFFFKKKKASC